MSHLRIDFNTADYNKGKSNLINLGYDVKIINFVDKNNTNHYNLLNYFTENSLLESFIVGLLIKNFSICLHITIIAFYHFQKNLQKNSKNKTVENFTKELNSYIDKKENNYDYLNFAKNSISTIRNFT